MPDMIHFIAIFELPDGEHVMHGWSENLKTARKHVDDQILSRRRALIPDEEAKLLNIRQVAPDKIDEEVRREDERIRNKYPDRLHAGEQFDVANRILEQRVTPDPSDPEILPTRV